MSTDLELLRAYEPIIRYTHGELFFPAAVEPYLAACDLLVGSTEGPTRLLIPNGELDAETLARQPLRPGTRFSCDWSRSRWVAWPSPDGRVGRDGPFSGPGPARPGRALCPIRGRRFNGSLLLRGKVPGGTAAAAAIKYDAVRGTTSIRLPGRVVRRGGWIVLHYLYFYFMNDWRSTFAGANDHEADLEQAFVVLEDAPDGPRRCGSDAPLTITRATNSAGDGTTRTSRASAITR